MTEKERNISWFNDLGKRKVIIEQFYNELENIGVNYEIGIKSYEHQEVFEFQLDNIEKKITNKATLKKVQTLIAKYEKRINHTCCDCGKKVVMGWDYFCRNCYFIRQKQNNYESINNLGFSCVDLFGTNNYLRRFIKWDEIAEVKFSMLEFQFATNYKSSLINSITFYLKETEYNEVISGSGPWISEFNSFKAYFWHENFYSLLRNIPDNLIDENDKSIKNRFINNLKDCRICGFMGIYEDDTDCLVCKRRVIKEPLHERMKRRFSSVEEVNKLTQLEYYSEDKDKFKYPRREKEFYKSKNYIKLVTSKEIKEYLKER